MTRSNKAILFLALALIVILYALMNYLRQGLVSIPKQNLRNSVSSINPNSKYEIPISSPIDISTALSLDINKWLTYRNEQFGFSIKYPPSWGVTNEGFAGDVWSIGFAQSEHDVNFGFSISRDPLNDKIISEKGSDFLRLEEGLKIDGVKIVKIIYSPNEYYKENIISYIFTHHDYSFALRGDPELLHLALPTLHFF